MDLLKLSSSLIFIQSKGRHAMTHKDTGLYMTSLSNKTSCNRLDISIFNPMQHTSLNSNYFKEIPNVITAGVYGTVGTDCIVTVSSILNKTDNHATVARPLMPDCYTVGRLQSHKGFKRTSRITDR